MTVHSVAILKGAVEGAPGKHLASLLAWGAHLAPLLAAGLVTVPDGEPLAVEPTDAGREFYQQHQLAELPPGRANAWTGSIADAAVAALDKLTEG